MDECALLEVGGADRKKKADLLAEKLWDTIKEVLVSRPVRHTDVLVSGLDEVTSINKAVAFIATFGDGEGVRVTFLRFFPDSKVSFCGG